MLIEYDGEQHGAFSFIMLNFSSLLYTVVLLPWWGLLKLLLLVLCICLFHTVGKDKCRSPVVSCKASLRLEPHWAVMRGEENGLLFHPHMYSCVVSVYVCQCAHPWVHVWKPDVYIGYLLFSLPYFLRQVFHWTCSSLLRLAGQWAARIYQRVPSKYWGYKCAVLPSALLWVLKSWT